MKKTNLLKAVVCGIMITLVMTSTVFAGAVSREKYVRGETAYTDVYDGAVGHYIAAGDRGSARTTITNTSTGAKWFECYIYRYNHNSQSFDDYDIASEEVANGATMSVVITRDMNSRVYDYKHVANGYASSVYSSATIVDNYTLRAKQYYE